MMKTKWKRTLLCAVLLLVWLLPVCGGGAAAVNTGSADADVRYTDPETGYKVYLLDELDLLTAQEEAKLVEEMKPITQYGDIIFWSTDAPAADEIEQAKIKRQAICGYGSSGILCVNMSLRMITFQSDGDIYRWVSASKARSITDNVSHYASRQQYYACASEAYREVYTVLQGNAIAEPMKYISFTVIGLMIAFVLVVGVVFGTRLNPLARKNKETARLIGSGTLFCEPVRARKTDSRTRTWVTVLWFILSSIGSGGGSSSGGGGGSSGGGGGGSSRF